MEHPPHVTRMLEEADELSCKLTKAQTFLVGEVFQQLPDMDQALLNAQIGAMTAYLSILNVRIDRSISK